MYSEKVMEHFRNPRNVGEIENPDGVGEVGNPVCGDMMTFYVKIDNGILTDVKFKTFGCGAAIAVSSMVSEMAKGKTVDEAMKITNADVAKELGGLPPNKLHCSNLGADALHRAIENYLAKQQKTGKRDCLCPYCDAPVEGGEICAPCQAQGRK
jgi:nitrogen fixation NifU-like protein